MIADTDLSQSKQPQSHYDYDGLSGGWLWFPWWVHLIVALLIWPICWWVIPLLPLEQLKIRDYALEYRLYFAGFLSLGAVITGIMSYVKAIKLAQRKIENMIASSKKQLDMSKADNANTKEKVVKSKPSNKTSASKKAEKPKKKTEYTVVKAKSKATKKAKQNVEGNKVKVASKVTVKAKTKSTRKKKSDKQMQLDL